MRFLRGEKEGKTEKKEVGEKKVKERKKRKSERKEKENFGFTFFDYQKTKRFFQAIWSATVTPLE